MAETAGWRAKLMQDTALGSAASLTGYTTVDGVTAFSGPLSRAILDISNFKDQDGFKRFIYGMAERKLSVSGKRIFGDTEQDIFSAACLAGTTTFVAVLPDGTNGVKFEVLVASFDETPALDGTTDFSMELQMTGAPLSAT